VTQTPVQSEGVAAEGPHAVAYHVNPT